MKTIESRIEKLEQQSQPQEIMEMFIVLVSPKPLPDPVVLGWSFYDNDSRRVCIMREPAETDDALQSRASATARMARPGCNQVYIPVTEPALKRIAEPLCR